MIEFLLLDLDDTILDFHMQEHFAIRKTLPAVGVEPTDEVCALYSKINLRHWKLLEMGEITREKLAWHRFLELFEVLGVEADPHRTSALYWENLATGHYFLPGAEEAVKTLAEKYRLYMVTNGTASVQHSRIASAGLAKYFEKIFISQEIGADKPAKAYFDKCVAQIPGFDREKALVVGDSLSSDIRGGKNAGIATCWVNPKGKVAPPENMPDYEVKNIAQLEALLETI